MPRTLSGYSPTQEYWGTRFAQLDLIIVSLHVTVDQIAGGFVPRPDPSERLPHNRAIKVQHAKDFAEYLLRGAADGSGKWSVIVPALSLWTSPTGVEFDPDDELSTGGPIDFGVFRVIRSTTMGIWDGQHRVLGVYMAVAKKEDELRARADDAQKAERAGDPRVHELQDALVQATEERRRLGEITIPVAVALETDQDKIATLFADVANNAKGINATALGRLDHRQVFNRVAGALITGTEGWSLLVDLVDDDNAYTTHNNPYWTTWRDVVDVARTVWLGYGARWSEQQEQARLADEEPQIAATTRTFYEVLHEAFPDVEDVLSGTIEARDLRGGGSRPSLLASSTTIKALASAYHDLTFGKAWLPTTGRRFARETGLPCLDRDAIAEGFAALPPMTAGSEQAIDPFWKDAGEGLFQHPWAAPTARAGNVRTLGKAIARHVREEPS